MSAEESESARTIGFVRMVRSEATLELMRDPKAFTLLALIAYRARWKPGFNQHDLAFGEALIGDHKSSGLSPREYRTRLNKLKKWQFVTTKATSRGTVATLCSSLVFDIRPFELFGKSDELIDEATTNNRRARDERKTSERQVTNKEKKGKQERRRNTESDSTAAESIYREYPKKVGKPAALSAIRKALESYPAVFLLGKTREYGTATRGADLQFIPHPSTWFNQERFNDDPSTWKGGQHGAANRQQRTEADRDRDRTGLESRTPKLRILTSA